MKKSLCFKLIFLFVSVLFLQNSFAQEVSQSHLPDGAKARIDRGGAYTIKFSPDGKRVVIGGRIGVWIYDAHTGEALAQPSGPHYSVRSLDISSDGSKIVSGNGDGTIRLWDANTGKHIHTHLGHHTPTNNYSQSIFNSISGIALSPDGKTIVSGGSDGTIRLWNANTGQHTHTLTRYNNSERPKVAFSPDGKTIVDWGIGETIRLWDAKTKQLKHTLTGHNDRIISIALSPDGKTIVSGDLDGTIRLWNTNTGTHIRTLTERINSILRDNTLYLGSVEFSRDGKTIAIKDADGTTRLWDTKTDTQILTEHNDGIKSIALSPDGRTIVSGDEDGIIRFWNVNTGKLKHTFTAHKDGIDRIVWSPDGNTLVSNSGSNDIRLWNAKTGAHIRTLFTSHTHWIFSVAFSPDGNTIASAGVSGGIHLWDANTGTHKRTLVRLTRSVNSVAFSPDGNTIASADESRLIRLWDTNTGKLKQKFTRNKSNFTSMAFSPDGNTIVSAGGGIRLWDANTGKIKKTLSVSGGRGVAFSPDGNTIVSASGVRLWDANTGKIKKTLSAGTHRGNCVAFSPDGNTIASGSGNYGKSQDFAVRLWDANTRKLKHTLIGHFFIVHSVAFSPDGKTIASGGRDNTVRLWDAKTGKLKKTLIGHSHWVESLAFSPDGSTLASGSGDGTVLLWEIASVKQVLLAASQRPPMYWVNTQTGTLHRLVGANIENLLTSIKNVINLAVDTTNGKLYWTTKINKRSGTIQRANLDGSNVQLVKNLTSVPLDIALDTEGEKLYLTNSWGKLQRLNLDGSDFQPNLITGLQSPNHLALDTKRGKIYWTEQTDDSTGKVRSANLDGSDVRLVKELTSLPHGLAVDAANRKLYLTSASGHIQRMTLVGSYFRPNLITGLGSLGKITVDTAGRKLYWTENGRIRRANFNGQNIQDIVTRIGAPADITLGVRLTDSAIAAPATIAVPDQTLLLSNYPNPFNPETWIPYQLAVPSDVRVTIYDTRGIVVRQLELEHQPAGFYTGRSRAAYWDGRNTLGERVASGIYFYRLEADTVSLMRKMVILK